MLIRDCCQLREGYVNPSQSEQKYFDGNIKWLRANDLNNSYIYETTRTLTKTGFESAGASAILFKPGTIAISKSGTIGRVGILKDYMCGNRAIINIEPDIEKVDTMYLFYWLLSNRSKIERRALGSIQKNLYVSLLGNFDIGNFSLKEQKEITKQIDPIYKKIINNDELILKMEDYIRLLFYKWFVDFNFPDKNGIPYKNNGGAMYDINGKMHPIGWKYKPIDDIAETIIDHRGKTPKKLGSDWSETGITALSAKTIKGGKLVNLDKANKVSRELYEKWMPEKLAEGDILMTSEAPLGEFYFILFDTEYCLSQRLFAIRANTLEVLPSYLYLELSQPRGLKKILARQSGSTVFGIRQEELRKVEVLVPTLSIQNEFNKLVLPMMRKIRMCEKENEKLIELRDLLIKKLIK